MNTITTHTRDRAIENAINASFSALRTAGLQAQRLESSLRNAGFSPETLAAVVAASIAPITAAIYREISEQPLLAAIREAETTDLFERAQAAAEEAFSAVAQ